MYRAATLPEIGLRLREEKGLQAFMQNCKCVVLLGLLGDPGMMRENHGHIDKRDPSIRRWSLREKDYLDSARDVVTASVTRRMDTDFQAKGVKWRPRGCRGLDSESEGLPPLQPRRTV